MNKNITKINSSKPPVVELDSAAHAAYVRFSRKKVARTEPVESGNVFITIDFAFSIDTLLDKSRVQAPKALTRKTRYIPACA